MGKAILLSDIAVHREQAPDRAKFFPADNGSLLAEKMSSTWDQWDNDVDGQFIDRAAARLPARRRAFARRYEDIVLATLARHDAGVKRAEVPAPQSHLER